MCATLSHARICVYLSFTTKIGTEWVNGKVVFSSFMTSRLCVDALALRSRTKRSCSVVRGQLWEVKVHQSVEGRSLERDCFRQTQAPSLWSREYLSMRASVVAHEELAACLNSGVREMIPGSRATL